MWVTPEVNYCIHKYAKMPSVLKIIPINRKVLKFIEHLQVTVSGNTKLFQLNLACRIKADMNWTTKNIISSHYFSKKIKTSTRQEHER